MTRGELVDMRLKTAKTRYWTGGLTVASLFACVTPAQAQSQLVITYTSVIFGVMSDSGDLRESMRREHRERVERSGSGKPGPALSGAQRSEEGNESAQAEQREAESAARRARWQRMSPEEREQMHRDIHQAGRAIYPQNPPRGGN